MKRRQLVQYAGTGLLTALGLGVADRAQAQTAGLTIRSLGHMCFQFTGDKQRILVNPYRTLGCTAGYRSPKVETDLLLISSQLLDEGAVEVAVGNPRLLYKPGVYQLNPLRIQGIQTDHDRLGGKRFGANIAWLWKQAGITVLHLGGTAAPITLEQKILMGRPDVLFVPVGGGPKAYSPAEARQAIQSLNPKLIVPMQYSTQAANKSACDLVPIDAFLSAMGNTPVRRSGDSLTLRSTDLPTTGTAIQVMSYRF